MKIQVVRRDGSHEILTLTEPLEIKRGEILNRLVTSTGMEHWFTQDGLYDGWGMAVSIPVAESNWTPEEIASFGQLASEPQQPPTPGLIRTMGGIPAEAREFIQQIEDGREFPEAGEPEKP